MQLYTNRYKGISQILSYSFKGYSLLASLLWNKLNG